MEASLRKFETNDIEFALAQAGREGWDTPAEFFRVCLAHDPHGCFIAEIDRRRVGMVTTTRYVHSAWVGNLIVQPDCRQKGIGRCLMVHALDHLEVSGVRTVRLEGDPMGLGIYRRLGFVDQFDSLRFRKQPPHMASRGGAAQMNSADLDEVRALDLSCFGDDRGRLLELLLGKARAAYCVRVNRRVEGFATALPSTAGVRLGPCVAIDLAVAEELLDSVLTGFPDTPIVAGVPSVNRVAVELLESRGFTRTPPSLRMLRGEAAAESTPGRIVAIANGAMG